MIVLFSGAHGTGKTTVINDLKDQHPEKLQEYTIVDSVSEKFFKREDFNHPESLVEKQQAFSRYQMDLWESSPNAISSRSYADIWAYTKYQMIRDNEPKYQEQLDEIEQRCKKAVANGAKFVYFPIMFDLVGKELRSTNVEFQREIDSLIVGFFQKMNIDVHILDVLELNKRIKFIKELIC